MKDKFSFNLINNDVRQRAAQCVLRCPEGYMVEIKPASRSKLQNARMWAMLADISKQVEWHGRHLTPWEWKCVLSAAVFRLDVVPGIDGGFVVIGQETSKMSVLEMNTLMLLMEEFGAQHEVIFTEPDHGWQELADRS